MFDTCGQVDLSQNQGVQVLTARVDALLAKVKKKYKEYGIKEKPFVIVKADNSSSGMGIMTVRDIKDLPGLLEKTASTRQGSDPLQELILQEGILTHERINAAVAEPVVYMMDRYVVGGFYRVHADRGEDENLSAPGSSYVPLAFGSSAQLPQLGVRPGASEPNRFYMYGVIGRLAMLAASYELEATDPERDTYDE
jgi:glutamate--cysteine ligase